MCHEMTERKFTMFINDVGCSMHFVLLIPDKELRRRMEKLIRKHIGAVSTDLNDISDYTIVLQDDEAPIPKYPEHIFKLSYIKDCIDEGSLLDVSKYLKGISPKFVSDFDYMMIVYFREYTWNNVPTKYLLKKNKGENRGRSGIESVLSENKEAVSSVQSAQVSTKSNGNRNAVASVQSIESKRKQSTVSKRRNVSSSSDTESDDSVAALTSSKRLDKNSSDNESDDSVVCLKSSKGPDNHDKNDSSSSDSESDDSGASVKSSKGPDESSSDDESGDPVVCLKSSKGPDTPDKKTKSSYTKREKESILRYIIKNEEYKRLKGNTLWQEMEDAKICDIRTWQSMKEHFRKCISKELNMFSFLTEQQKKKLNWTTN